MMFMNSTMWLFPLLRHTAMMKKQLDLRSAEQPKSLKSMEHNTAICYGAMS